MTIRKLLFWMHLCAGRARIWTAAYRISESVHRGCTRRRFAIDPSFFSADGAVASLAGVQRGDPRHGQTSDGRGEFAVLLSGLQRDLSLVAARLDAAIFASGGLVSRRVAREGTRLELA